MKFTEENLKKLRYSEKTGKWYKGNTTYIKMDACKVCGEHYLTSLVQIKKGNGKYCDDNCSKKSRRNNLIGKKFGRYEVKKFSRIKNNKSMWLCECICGKIKEVCGQDLLNKKIQSCGCLNRENKRNNLTNKKFGRLIVKEDYGNGKKILCKCDCGEIKEISRSGIVSGRIKSCGCSRKKNKKIIGRNNPQWKGGVTEKNLPLYDTYANQIDYCEEVRRNPEDENILQVKCTYCGKWYTPTRDDIGERIKAINGKISGENRLYCSDECKKECPIYGKHEKTYLKENSPYYEDKFNTQREVQPELRQMVFEIDGYGCQRCGSTKRLHCHHITGVELNPIESADVDNCITFCKKCHKWIHSLDGCTYQDYKRKKCEDI